MNTVTTLPRTTFDTLATRHEQLARTIDLALVRLYTNATGHRSWWNPSPDPTTNQPGPTPTASHPI